MRLKSDSRFVMTDILACGRTARKERFAFKSRRSRTAVYCDDRLCFLDNQKLIPKDIDPSGIGFFERHSHTGMMYIYGKEPHIPENDRLEAAVTNACKGVCIRAAVNSADEIWRYFGEIIA